MQLGQRHSHYQHHHDLLCDFVFYLFVNITQLIWTNINLAYFILSYSIEQPISTENCHWQYGVFPHTTSCTRYWHCWNGTATIQQCPFSLLYNDAVHACDWPDNVPDCQKHRK